MMKQITMIYPYYENPEFFNTQIMLWWKWPEDLCDHVNLIVVDDCSQNNPAEEVLRRHDELPLATRLFRVGVDIRWNWLAARNIGAHFAQTEWLMLTDMDHVVPIETAKALISGKHDPSTIYRFSRIEHDGTMIHPHPNSWFMTRKMYWKIGGYDEALSGYYGTDGDYRRRCAATAHVEIMDLALVRYEYQGDSSTRKYLRKQPEDARGKQMMKARPKNWKPKVLSFPYKEVQL